MVSLPWGENELAWPQKPYAGLSLARGLSAAVVLAFSATIGLCSTVGVLRGVEEGVEALLDLPMVAPVDAVPEDHTSLCSSHCARKKRVKKVKCVMCLTL